MLLLERKRACHIFFSLLAACRLINVRPGSIGVLYLYVKTIERAHTPAHMWEKIKLSNNYSKALEQVSVAISY